MTIASTQSAAAAGATPPQNGFSLISNDKLLQLYATMLKCRMLEERIRLLTGSNRLIGPHAVSSQEAAAAGVGVDLLPGDTLAPSPRGFIQCFVKGLPLDRIFSAHCAGTARYAPLKLIPPSLSLAAQLNRAISVAIANKKSRNKKIVVAFCGSACDSTGILHAAMRRAGALSLPILMVFHSHSDAEDICLQAQGYGFPGVTVDGDDAVAVYRVATEAIAHARRGSGPTLIDCKPWPLGGTEPGRRRTVPNPILNMEQYLTRKGLFDRKFKSEVRSNFRRELDAASKTN